MNYPKMLYKGNQEKYQTIIANDEDYEADLVAGGWLEYGELPEREQGVEDPRIGDRAAESIDGTSVAKQNKELQEQLAFTEEQLATSQGEFIAFKNDVSAMKARIDELEPISALGNVLNPNNHSDLTLEQLQAELDAKGVKYLKRDNKATLLELLNNQSKE